MNKLLLIPLLALVVMPAALADDGEMKAEIQEVLIQRHPMDTDAWWRALGPDAPGVIIGMYQESTNMLHKLHLLQGLAAFSDDPKAVAFLRGEAKSQTSVIRGTALGALGASQGEKALDALSEGLKSEDPQTRLAAAKAIHRIGLGPAKDLLDGYLKSEKVEWIGRQVLADEKPQALKPVVPPNEARLEEFVGKWKGFWIAPNAATKPQLISLAATASLKAKDQKLEGEIQVGARRLVLKPEKVQNGRWQGLVQLPKPHAGELEFLRSKNGATLILKVPLTGETAVFLKY